MPTPIRSLLIANRGEIAVRIARTCRTLGIRTIAVYSDADAAALHVRSADVAVRIGEAPSQRSYLDAGAIADAALAHGADAVHPGYGFLSESTRLIERCERDGLTFVGPSLACIAQMGSKIEAKRIAERAGVAVVPGYHGDAQDDATLLAAAQTLGMPVLIKASAGGGGKGMRVVRDANEFLAALALVRHEAQASFGDGRVLLERYLERPRHLEVQLAGDRHGNLVHLFERECSIQRRNQKVIEEAPAAFLAPADRASLHEAAVQIGKAIGYDSLGTVEFIRDDASGATYFLEMNTRLQVEHPVTECITGLDLVEMQIRLAGGERLAFSQADVTARGWAIEARVCAEDPAASDLPAVGSIIDYHEPQAEGVRVDSGVSEGSEITSYYDSLLAKVIAYGPDRATAAARAIAALEAYRLAGVTTNLEFLRDVLAHPQFTGAALTTRYLSDVFPQGWAPNANDRVFDDFVAALAYAIDLRPRGDGHHSPWRALGPWRVLRAAGHDPGIVVAFERAGEVRELRVSGGPANFTVERDGERVAVRAERNGPHLAVTVEGTTRSAFARVLGTTIVVAAGARNTTFELADRDDLALRPREPEAVAGRARVVAPMPGVVNAVAVRAGDTVARGADLVIFEAMKLVHQLTAPAAGVVHAVHCRPGDVVAGGALLVELADLPANGKDQP